MEIENSDRGERDCLVTSVGVVRCAVVILLLLAVARKKLLIVLAHHYFVCFQIHQK